MGGVLCDSVRTDGRLSGGVTAMKNFRAVVAKLLNNEEGAALVEYGMLVALIAVVCIVAVTNIGTKISKAFNTINTKLPT